MKKHEYIARRPFASFKPGSELVEPGDPITIPNKRIADDMQKKGLIFPNYTTKEDKEAMKVQKPTEKATIEWDAGPMFFVKVGDRVIDRLKKAEAEKLRDELNK